MKSLYSVAFSLLLFAAAAQPFYRITKLPLNEQAGIQFTDTKHAFWWGSTLRGLLLRTSDKGLTWDSIVLSGFTQNSYAKILSGCFFNKDTGLVAAVNYTNSTKGIYKTYDNGNSWTLKTTHNMPLTKIIFKGNLGYAFTAVFNNIEVYKSTDFGETWTNFSYILPMPDYGAFQIQDASITPAGGFIAVTDGGKILSYNAGIWQVMYSDPALNFHKIFFPTAQTGYALAEPQNICVQFPGMPPPLCGFILKTVNAGATWDTLPRLNYWPYCVNGISADTIYFGYGSQILISYDGGVTRQAMANTNFQYEVMDIIIRKKKIDYVFVTNGDESSLYSRLPADSLAEPLDTLDVGISTVLKSASEPIISPNPSPGDFNLKVRHSTACLVSASLYNLQGERIKTYLQEKQIIRGDGNYPLDANDVPPGMYFLRLKVNDKEYSYKLIRSPD